MEVVAPVTVLPTWDKPAGKRRALAAGDYAPDRSAAARMTSLAPAH